MQLIDNAGQGNLPDASVSHDKYLYGKTK